MFNYKTLSIFLLFVDFSWLGLVELNHDSYKLCLSIASVILAATVVCCFLSNRILRVGFLLILAVVFSQFSMVAREAIEKPEYRENFNQRNTTDELWKDIKHAFKRLVVICKNGSIEPEGEETSEEKSGKYRYGGLILGCLLTPVFFPIFRKPRKERKK